jgi:hypothetical protein
MKLQTVAAALAAAMAGIACTVVAPEEPKCDPTCCGAAPCCRPCPVDDAGCDPTCCGGPPPCCATCPVDRSAVEVWMVRLDAGAANVATVHEAFVNASVRALQDAGFDVSRVLLADLYRPERGLFFQGWTVYDDLHDRWLVPGVADAIQLAAITSGEVPRQCATESLATIGTALQYFIGAPPAALLVGVLDVAARPLPYSDAACDDAGALFAGADPASWVPFPGAGLERGRTRFVVLASSESVSGAEQRALCLAAPGIPATAVDVIAPSPLAYYDPWTADLSSYVPGLALRRDVCRDAGAWTSDVETLARAWATELGIGPR